ncbi:MAG TPA: CoA-binding protein [Candidatus Norongarragalinales archaeon]|nr:CoA-binding protein [Candidatus Norongarragalinales archaeon]
MNLRFLLEPKNIAVVGASDEKDSVGHGILASLLKGSVFPSKYAKPFRGKVFAVNPHHAKIMGLKSFPSVLQVNEKIDLAVIAVPAAVVPQVLRECGAKKIPAAVVVSAGFGETGNKPLEEEVKRIALQNDIALLGPNTVGVMVPGLFNASFALSVPKPGNVAFVSQSGALADSVIDWALEELFPFRAIVGLGNETVLDESVFINHFADDGKTKVIALYLEGVKDGKKFLGALRFAKAKGKSVIVLKGGVGARGSKAAQTHTASLAGDDAVFDGALKQGGAKRVFSLEELFEVSKALSMQPYAKKNSIAIITNGGGAGVLCADACEKQGVKLAELDARTIAKLEPFMHKGWSRGNPVDLVGDALPERYGKALDAILSQESVGGAIVIQTLQTMTKPAEDARAVAKAARKFGKPVACSFMGGLYTRESIRILHENSIPNYSDPVKAAKAMSFLVYSETGK